MKTANETTSVTPKTQSKGRYKTVDDALTAKRKQALLLLKNVDLKTLTDRS